MNTRKIKRRALDRLGKHPRCADSRRLTHRGKTRRHVIYYAALTSWVHWKARGFA